MAYNKKKLSAELDADLENDLLEWSEDYAVGATALVALFGLIKKHIVKHEQEPSISSTSKTKDKNILKKLPANMSVGERLQSIHTGQLEILHELSLLRKNSKSSGGYSETLSNKQNIKEDIKIFLTQLPFSDANIFVEFEKKLSKNIYLQQKLRKLFLSTTNEEYLKKYICVTMQKLMRDECAVKFSWCGQMKNIAVKDFKIFQILKECAAVLYENSSDKEIVQAIIKWFHRATDRSKYKLKRKTDIVNNSGYETEDFLDSNDESEDFSQLPCKTTYDLKKLEIACKKYPYLQDQLRDLFASCPEYEITGFIYYNIRKLIAPEIIAEVSWTGINSKICLRNLLIIKIFIECVMEKYGLASEEKVIPIIRRALYGAREKIHASLGTIKIEKDESTTIEMEFIDPLSMNFNEVDYDDNTEELNMISELPCKTELEFEKFEKESAENVKLQIVLKDYFKKTKDTSFKTFTDYNMKQLISDEVAVLLKMPVIKFYTTIEIMKDSVMERYPEIRDFEALDAVKTFLYKAQDRYRKKQSRLGNNTAASKYEDYSEIESLRDEETSIEDISALPCLTLRQFIKFENRFKGDEHLKKGLRQMFASESNEKSCKKFINMNFKKIIEDEVAVKLCWANIGISAKDLISIKNLKIIQLLRECTQEAYPELTTDFINDEIRTFIYRTKERVRKRFLKYGGKLLSRQGNTKRRKLHKTKYKSSDDSFNCFGLESIFYFPLNSLENFEEFEKLCQGNEEYQECLEAFFKKMTDCDHLAFIDKNLRKLIKDEVSGSFTWHGRQGNKAAKNFTCIKVLQDCTESIYPTLTQKDIIDTFTRSFRRSKDRTRKHELKLQDCAGVFAEEIKHEDNDTNMEFEGETYESLDEDYEELSDVEEDVINLSCLPCLTVTDFNKFEKCCKRSDPLQANLKVLFEEHREVVDAKKFCTENIKKLLPDEIAAQFSFAGQQSNISVKNFTTIKILKEATMARYNLMEDMAISVIKRCFYMVKDRVRIRIKKQNEQE